MRKYTIPLIALIVVLLWTFSPLTSIQAIAKENPPIEFVSFEAPPATVLIAFQSIEDSTVSPVLIRTDSVQSISGNSFVKISNVEPFEPEPVIVDSLQFWRPGKQRGYKNRNKAPPQG